MEPEHKRLPAETVDHTACSPDEVWNELKAYDVPPEDWRNPPPMPLKQPSGTTGGTSDGSPPVLVPRPDAELMKLARISQLPARLHAAVALRAPP